MRILTPEFSEHLAGEIQTTCNCWLVRRKDGVVLGFTDHDDDLTVNSVPCIARTGFEASVALSELGLSADDQDIAGAFSHDAIEKDDLIAGRYDGAMVELWLVNWRTPDQCHHLKTYLLGEVQWEGERFKVELRGLTSLLDQPVGRIYSRHCDAILGDGRCSFDLNNPAYKTSGTITSVINQNVYEVAGLAAFENGWFDKGNLTFTSGRNTGLSFELSSSGSTQTRICLWLAPELQVEPGDTFSLTAGCDKSFVMCKTKYDNSLNFQGCPHMPVSEFVFSYADKLTEHDGGPLVE